MKLTLLGSLLVLALIALSDAAPPRRTPARSAAATAQDEPADSTPEVYFFVRSGQSLSRGAVGYCGTSSTPPCSTGMEGNFMLGTKYPPGGDFQPLREFAFNSPPAVETSATSMCNQFSSLSRITCGTANYGWPGASILALRKNASGCTPPCMFDNSIGLHKGEPTGTGVMQAFRNAAAMGARLIAPGVYYNQGEAEMNGGVTADTYARLMAELQADYQSDINAAIGQQGLVPLFIVQKSSWAAWGARRTTPTTTSGGDGVPIGQLKAALDNYSSGRIFLIAPEYATAYGADGVHKPADSYRKQGVIEGKVLYQVTAEKRPWRPFYPRSVTLSGNLLRVRFWVPYGSLVFDETTVAPLPDGFKGFELTDSGDSGVMIASVALTENEPDSIDITLSGVPSGAVELRYAWTAAETGPAFSGPKQGPRGNVADSDDRLAWNGDPLRDFALSFRIADIRADSPYVWEPPDPDNLHTIPGRPAAPAPPPTPNTPCENCDAPSSSLRRAPMKAKK